ncbi:GNAT family N-acetyltransferase [Pseudoalteromonas sp. JBTF-M23]|uniref:GNAT family N-acetyltransferase n=1 Tax=Pseudoalteromonas caenipelagi TaxID=2726988 RepID=A0A849VBN9_9GAMM|nr:GNAT family N-acetyltransferase [Pseudoalteromonas caenipelagi]NOU50782.1 GNAT family N-acetyltransferase [Pseudoalteromonas caenipelagi]
MKTLTSERFLMRFLTQEDATEQYIGWLTSPVSEFIINKPVSIPELRQYILEQGADNNVYFYGIFTLEDAKHIGNIKFIVKEGQLPSFEMGILIGESDWHGKGVAKEVIECFAAHAKKQLGISRMTLGVDKANKSAVSAYEKIGFTAVNDGRTDNGLTMSWEF